MIITIDGPTASGKSTIAKMLAHKLGYYYLNTGFLYRALAYVLINAKNYTIETLVDPKHEDVLDVIKQLTYTYDNGTQICYRGNDITSKLKEPLIDQGSSIVSSVSLVRALLLDFQRDVAKHHDVVVEGRDTGTVVFPHADYKFYLTAQLDVRAQRWQEMQKKRGNIVPLEEAKKSIAERDKRDSTREIAPLTIPEDAIVIDNSNMSQQGTLEAFLKRIQ